MVKQTNRHPGIITALEAAEQGGQPRPPGADIMVCGVVIGRDEQEHFFSNFTESMSDALEDLGWIRDGYNGPVIWACINHLGRTWYHLEDGEIVQDFRG